MSGWTPRKRIVERFLEKTEISATGCWEWKGAVGAGGYGSLRCAGRSQPAHRVAYELFVGSVPNDMVVDHLCRKRDCVNPAHLEVVTRGENVMRGEGFAPANAAKTHCIHGHEFTPENTMVDPSGWRRCRTCSTEGQRRRAAERQAA